jgi:hypothetical protein
MFRLRLILPAVVIAAALAGCETRVVKVENSWVGSQVEMAEKRYPREKPKSDPLKETGEALFGWTDSLFGKKKKRPVTGQQVGEISGHQLREKSSANSSQQTGG